MSRPKPNEFMTLSPADLPTLARMIADDVVERLAKKTSAPEIERRLLSPAEVARSLGASSRVVAVRTPAAAGCADEACCCLNALNYGMDKREDVKRFQGDLQEQHGPSSKAP